LGASAQAAKPTTSSLNPVSQATYQAQQQEK